MIKRLDLLKALKVTKHFEDLIININKKICELENENDNDNDKLAIIEQKENLSTQLLILKDINDYYKNIINTNIYSETKDSIYVDETKYLINLKDLNKKNKNTNWHWHLKELAFYLIKSNWDLYSKTTVSYNDAKEYFNQKYIALALSLSAKSLSTYLNEKDLKKKQFYTNSKKDKALNLIASGHSISEVAKKCKINNHTLRNLKKDLESEYIYDNMEEIPIKHNEIIILLGNEISKFVNLYSEHISYYNELVGDNFKRMDLLGFKNKKIILAIEIEITNDIYKSLQNLKSCPPNALKILLTTAKKIKEARKYRDSISNINEIKVIKIHKGMEKNVLYLLKRKIKCNIEEVT